ncbi:MAG: hypothetical protein ABSA41_14970 [Terriglobia bacterium]|jgi:hypothetical protein
MDTRQMKAEKASILKADLKRVAEREGIDLSLPDNKFTLWVRMGEQEYACREHASYPDKIYQFLGQQHLFGTATTLILEENGERVRLVSCEVG